MQAKIIGRKFNRLRVRYALEPDRFGKPYFCCVCDCGATCRVRASKLLSGRQKSCGCYRADPKVRREARMKVPAAKRKAIAKKGQAACEGRHVKAFSMDAYRAADLLGVSVERIELMAKDEMLPHVWRKGALFVSSEEVGRIAAEQCRQKKRCKAETKMMLGELAKRTDLPEGLM